MKLYLHDSLTICRLAGIRTLGPLIKSQLLYQLSYEPKQGTKVTVCLAYSNIPIQYL